MGSWPDWLPSNCPPANATAAHGQFFRLVEHSVIQDSDFWSQNQEFISGIRQRRFWLDDQDCQFSACSVYGEFEDAEQTRKSVGPLKHKLIALGTLTGSGKLLASPTKGNSHHDWWRVQDDQSWETFEVVE